MCVCVLFMCTSASFESLSFTAWRQKAVMRWGKKRIYIFWLRLRFRKASTCNGSPSLGQCIADRLTFFKLANGYDVEGWIFKKNESVKDVKTMHKKLTWPYYPIINGDVKMQFFNYLISFLNCTICTKKNLITCEILHIHKSIHVIYYFLVYSLHVLQIT